MSFFSPEKFNLERSEIKEPWKEEFEIEGKNKIEISFSGKKEKIPDGNLWEINSLKISTPQERSFDFISLLPKNWRIGQIEGILPPERIGDAFCFTFPDAKEIAFFEKARIPKKTYWEEKQSLPPVYENENEGRIVTSWGQIIEYHIIKTPLFSKFLFVILHEIGHSWQKISPKYADMKEKMQQAIKEGGDLSFKEKIDYWKYVVEIEREACAYALKEYRKLKKEGINILPSVKTNKEILETIEYGLKTSLFGKAEYYHFLPKEVIRDVKKKRKTITKKILEYLKNLLIKEGE